MQDGAAAHTANFSHDVLDEMCEDDKFSFFFPFPPY
jgi:hypothetical protein